MITETLTPHSGPPRSGPPRPRPTPSPAAAPRRTARLIVVAVAFVVATITAGALVIPAAASLIGRTISPAQGALFTALAWVPSALFVAGRSLAVRRSERTRLTGSR